MTLAGVLSAVSTLAGLLWIHVRVWFAKMFGDAGLEHKKDQTPKSIQKK